MRNVKYPQKDTGDVAPGMSVIVSISFSAPSFGDFDLYVSSNSNKNKDSFLNVGCIYSNGSINRKNYNRNFIADSIYFSTKEIEIFQIG